MCPPRVLLLWALLCPVRGNVRKEIFTRPGSNLPLPISRHLTLSHRDGRSCDQFEWKYKDLPSDNEISIVSHRGCKLTTYNPIFPNTRTSEDGGLIIRSVALEDGGIYSVYIHNSTKHHIQTDYYTVRVEGKDVQEEIFTRPGSDLLLPIRLHLALKDGTCDQFEWKYKDHYKEISLVSHKRCKLTTTSQLRPNTRTSENGGLIIYDVTQDNDGIYRVVIHNSRGRRIQTVVYTVHVQGNVPGVQEEIFTRPGSDLLLPIGRHLTLSHTDRWRCDQFDWKYKDPPQHQEAKIVSHRGCKVTTYNNPIFPNTRMSEDGSLRIYSMTLDNDGIYRVEICNSEGRHIKTVDYTVHAGRDFQEEIFTRPGSDLLLPIRLHLTLSHTDGRSCDQFEWDYKHLPRDKEISIVSHKGCKLTTTTQLLPNTMISENRGLIIYDVTLDNDGIYRSVILNSRGRRVQTVVYTVHVKGNVSGVHEEIFTRPGSDLLLPIRLHLTLSPTDGRSCDEFEWKFKDYFQHQETKIVRHRGCKVTTYNNTLFPNTRTSENGSLIIHNVTLDNDGIYRVEIYNSTGHLIQRDNYTVHVEGNVPDVQEEIFTRPGSDLLLPIRLHLTLSRTDGICYQFDWKYKDSPRHDETRIARHRGCRLYTYNITHFTNTRTSENGSLIIRDVTLDNDGIYSVDIYNSTKHHIQTDNYMVHVEVPVSVPVLNVSCLRNGSAEISCRAEEATEPNISLSVIGGSPGSYSASSNNITAFVGSPGPWNITCSVENRVSREMSRTEVTCPVPLSDIAVTSSCLLDGSAKAVCSVNGSDPRYSWSLDEESKSNESWVTLPPPVSGTLRCDVTNQINTLSRSINIYCTVPVSDPVLDVTCLQNGTSEISCRVEKGTDLSIFLTVTGGSEGYNVSSSERTVHVTVPPVSPPDSWNISCLVKNKISERSTNEIREPCLGIPSRWGHLLSPGAVCVLYTVLLICMVNDLRKMKNEMNRSERRTRRRRDCTEMEMEPVTD